MKDIVSFGNYITKLIKEGKKEVGPNGEYDVSHADIENWKDFKSKIDKVRAKFTCHKVESNEGYDNVRVEMSVVTSEGQGENADYSKYTPAGDLFIQVDNGTLGRDFFIEGKDYYLDFTSVPFEPILESKGL